MSKQKRSAAAKPKAGKQTVSRNRSLAGPKRVTFVGCPDDGAAAELPACSMPSLDASQEQSHSKATWRMRESTAAAASQLPQKPNLVPDTYAEPDGSQQSQGEGAKAAGKRLKRRRSSKSTDDKRFIKQFAAEAHALLGSSSSHPGKAAVSSRQECNMSPEAPKMKQEQTLGQGTALPEDSTPKEPVMGRGSARLAGASTQSIAAAQEEPLTGSPDDSTAPAGEQSCLMHCTTLQQPYGQTSSVACVQASGELRTAIAAADVLCNECV